MSRHIYLIDSGHSGLINGQYATAPSKMYSHGDGKVFYEGVSNRNFATDIMGQLYNLGISFINITDTELDLPLDVRADIANRIYMEYPNAILLSLHSNAGGGTGFEVWTSIGQTRSDKFAELLSLELIDSFPEIRFRKDIQDGDLDKESQFYILKHTNCPAILPECLFFDNYNDYKKLTDPNFRAEYVQAIVRWVQKCEELDL